MRARAVIGANFGDEGKGLVVDHLCATEGAGVVVRFNGGAQAGHTVETPHGKRHVFHHVGAGAFEGVPTFLSQFFVCNPLLFLQEVSDLNALEIAPVVYAHPSCLVTTFADMMINQIVEQKRGKDRHGSVGVGVNETIERSDVSNLRITMADIWNRSPLIEGRLVELCNGWATFRTGSPIARPERMIDAFLRALWAVADLIHPLGIQQCKDPIFEGAQGLMLDQDNKEFFPHLTRSNTGMKNVRTLCQQAGIAEIETYYVSRTYLTRHGAGPLPGEDDAMIFSDDTNLPHPFQGTLRFAPLDIQSLMARCVLDFGGFNFKLALTHCDQSPPPAGATADILSHGPTRSEVSEARSALKAPS